MAYYAPRALLFLVCSHGMLLLLAESGVIFLESRSMRQQREDATAITNNIHEDVLDRELVYVQYS